MTIGTMIPVRYLIGKRCKVVGKVCSNCGLNVYDSYYKIGDNYIQANYFETDELNCFCSKECLLQYISTLHICVRQNSKEKCYPV